MTKKAALEKGVHFQQHVVSGVPAPVDYSASWKTKFPEQQIVQQRASQSSSQPARQPASQPAASARQPAASSGLLGEQGAPD